MLIITQRVGYSEGKEVALVRLFLDGCYRGFHSHHMVKSATQIVKLLYLV